MTAASAHAGEVTPVSVDLLVRVDGEVVRLDQCAWVFTQPCGCVTGLMVASTSHRTCATEDQAWKQYQPNRIQRERDRAAGESAHLGITQDVCQKITWECPHEPKWGRVEVPIPAGHVWAAADSVRSRPRFKHLVAEHSEPRGSRWPNRLYPWDHGKVTALCGRSESREWSDDDWLVRDLPECSSCQKAAAGAVAA